MTTLPTLVGLAYSPWTERARWALEHHGVAYRFEPYLPLLGEPLLRARVRRLRGTVSVPVLFTEHGAVESSSTIALYAERTGRGGALFPSEHEPVLRAWSDRTEVALNAGRALLTAAMLARPETLAAAAPPFLPRPLRALAGDTGVRYLRFKYAHNGTHETELERTLAAHLETVRDTLARSGGAYLLGTLTFADLAVATMLQMVSPIEGPDAHLSDVERPAWTRPALARSFADVLRWRDALYAKHRHAGPT